MTPLDALARRMGEGARQASYPVPRDSEMVVTMAREALAWVEEQIPGREEIADVIRDLPYPTLSREIADALLALLREKLKGERT